MCLWALIQENTFCECLTKRAPQQIVQKHWPQQLGAVSVQAGPTLTFPYVAWVPKDKECLYTAGMSGLFQPEAKTMFYVTFETTRVPFKALYPWHGPEDIGRYPWH